MGRSRTASAKQAVRERNDLLSTKLTVPRLRPDRLVRSRLTDALDVAMTREVILVCTPAGFGKTTLLADWATSATGPVAWLSLDPDDNDPVRFWRYVVAALDRARGGLGERLLPVLTGSGARSGHSVVTAVINDVEAQDDDVVLVLDDYHVIDSPAIHDGLVFLVNHMPRRLHVAIATRRDPPLPLWRLRARHQLAELRAADIRFTLAESSAFLRQVWQLDLSAEVVAAVESRTEGWAVGLQLAGLSLLERSDLDAFLGAFTGSHRYVLDYLSEEVIERQPDRIRTFLLHSSILDRMSGPLCDAVTGADDGQELLEELERVNLFVVPLDGQRRWYRFHHLFAEVLRARLQRVDAGLVPDLHRRAAAWCERHGLVDEAIRHAVAAGAPMWAARLVEHHLDETLQRAETGSLARRIALLPGDAVRARPALCLAQGMLEFHAGRLDTAEACLDYADRAFGRRRVEQGVRVPTDGGMVSEVPAAVALLRGALVGVQGDAEGMARFARAALDHTDDDERGPRLWARTLRGCADWMSGRLADAEESFAAVLAEARAAPEAYATIATCFLLGRVQHARGDLDAALRTYEDGLRFATEGVAMPSLYHLAESHVGMAQVLYERDDLDRALDHVTEGIKFGRQVVDMTSPLLGLVALAWIRQGMGDPDGALDAMTEACRLRPSPDVVAMWNPAPSERVRLLLRQGRIDEARRWTRERGLGPNDVLTYPRERDYLALARVHVAQGEPETALRLLERLDRLAEPQGRVHSLIQIRTLQALAMGAAGNQSAALALLAEALEIARPAGFVRVFADEGHASAVLLRSLITTRPRARVDSASAELRRQVSRVLGACETTTPALGQDGRIADLVEALTKRELEVLRLIAAGRQNREIAQDLVVTLDTVKKHISHILTKLEATSRTHAVARARELGLIS
ncbi:MAG TPA: LuxR C-terminal-related transcriptional regulator [Kribbella sp.]|nr:LuxR C-terminal-related transcriptional regulator [Kribbella sp.]